MEIRFYTSPQLERAVMPLYANLREQSAARDTKKNQIVLVPDRFTQTFELQTLSALPDGGSFTTRIFSFTRLLHTLDHLSTVEFLPRQCSIMAIKRIANENKTKFHCFKRSCESRTFAENMVDLLQKLKLSDFDFERLNMDLLPKELGYRLQDIALISRAYTQFLGDRYHDTGDLLLRLPALCNDTYVRNADIHIAGFTQFNALELRAITAFFKQAKSVSLYVAHDENADIPQLSEAYQNVIKICNQLRYPYVELPQAPLSGNKLATYQYLFQGIKSENLSSGKSLHAYRASEPYDEVRYLAERIRILARTNGRHYRDIFLVLSSGDAYKNLIEKVFTDYEIPYYLSRKEKLSAHPLTRYLLSVLNLFRLGLDTENVLKVVKNLFFDVSDTARDSFENYILKYGIRFKRFLIPFDSTSESDELAEYVRQKIAALYTDLSLTRTNTADQYASQLQAFISGLSESQNKLKIRLNEFGDFHYEAYSRQVPERLSSILSDIQRIFSGYELSIDEFTRIFESGVDAIEVATTPAEADSVQIGDLKSALFASGKCLLLAGLSEGFPPLVSPSGILSEYDIVELNRQGAKLTMSAEWQNEMNKIDAYSLLLGNFEEYHFSFVLSESCRIPSILNGYFQMFKDIDIRSRQYYVDRENLEDDPTTAYFSALKNSPATDLLYLLEYTAKATYGEIVSRNLLDAHYKALLNSPLSPALRKLTSPPPLDEDNKNMSGLYFKNNRLSVSVIECFYTCPFKHFIRYGLRAAKREEATLRPMDIGNFLHAVAEKFVRRGHFDADLHTEVSLITELLSHTPEFERYFTANTGFLSLSRLTAECERVCTAIRQQLLQSNFISIYQEARFGEFGIFPPITLPHLPYKIDGKIDRVDSLIQPDGTYIRIIDYKSGNEVFDLCDLYTGVKIQLFVYLHALTSENKYKIAGVYYFPIHNKFTNLENADKTYRLRGMTLDRPTVILGSDTELDGNGGKSRIIPVGFNKLKKDGEMTLSAYSKVLSQVQFEGCARYAMKLIDQAIRAIQAGNHDISPLSGSCTYCEYKSICGHYDQQNERKLTQKIGIEQIMEAVGDAK